MMGEVREGSRYGGCRCGMAIYAAGNNGTGALEERHRCCVLRGHVEGSPFVIMGGYRVGCVQRYNPVNQLMVLGR